METVLIVSSILLWIIVLGNLLLTRALIRRTYARSHSSSPTLAQGLKVGAETPDFTAQILSGETVTRATYIGLKTAFVFISTNCQHCRDILPDLEALGPKAAWAGVEIVLVSKDTQEATSAFVVEMDLHVLPVLVAPLATNPFFKDYKALATPAYCLVNEQGKVQSTGYPSMDWDEWKALAESWKQDNTVPIPSGRM